MTNTIRRKTTGQLYHCIGIDFENNMEIVYLDPVEGMPSTSCGIMDCKKESIRAMSEKEWDQDELREIAIAWQFNHMSERRMI